MFFFRGPRPRNSSNPAIDAGRQAIPVLALLCAAGSAIGQQDIPLTLYAAEDLALADEPGRAAMLARADAMDEESVAAGELPDPKLRMALANYPIESGGFTTEGMTQAQLGLRMEFPRGETRAASSRRFQSLATEMRQSADGRSRDVLTAVRQAWLDVFYQEQAADIVSASRPFFADLVQVTRSMYSVGRRTQQDLLRAELELSRIDERLIEIERQRAVARAELSNWIGDNAFRPVHASLPAWNSLPTLEQLAVELSKHPAVRAADARIDAREAQVDVADSRFKPGWAVDLGYGYRNGSLASGEPRSDFVSLAFTIDLPFFTENRQDRRLAAALSERRAETAAREVLMRRLQSRLRVEFARWQDLSRRLALYEERILGQAGDHAQAALVAYQSDAADFGDVMRGYIDDLDARLDHVRLQVEQARSYAVIANLGGLPR